MSAWAAVVGAIVTAVAALIAAVWVAVLQRRAAPYSSLAERVVRLEEADSKKGRMLARVLRETDELRRQNNILVAALRSWVEWWERGGDPPPPVLHPTLVEMLETADRLHLEDNP